MKMNYDDYLYDPYDGNFYLASFGTLDVTFGSVTYPLSVTVNPSGTGTVVLSPAGGSYPADQTVTATASPASGYYFVAWALDAVAYYGNYTSNSNPISIVMNSAHKLTAYFEAQNQWTRAASNPILTPSSSGWDSYWMWNPRVFTYPNGTLGMIYGGRDGSGWEFGLATSPDAVHWTKYSGNPVLTKGTDTAWDSVSIAPGSVFWDGSKFVMYYWGTDSTTNPGYFGYATSTNSISWSKSSSNPIITPSGSHEDRWIRSPYVIKMGSTYKMWYAGNYWYVRYATSTDGINWSEQGDVLKGSDDPQAWDSGAIYSTAVVYDAAANNYKMLYSGGDYYTAIWRTGFATSPDGITWTKYPGNPIIGPSTSGGWESGDSTDWADILLRNGQIMLYYSGDKGHTEYPANNHGFILESYSIGLAYVSEIPLKAGWNLISLPIIPNNKAITSVLSSLISANEVSIVWSYTGTPGLGNSSNLEPPEH